MKKVQKVQFFFELDRQDASSLHKEENVDMLLMMMTRRRVGFEIVLVWNMMVIAQSDVAKAEILKGMKEREGRSG